MKRIYVVNIDLVKKDAKRIINFVKHLNKPTFEDECSILSNAIKLNDILNILSKSLGYNNYKELLNLISGKEPQITNLHKKENFDLKIDFNKILCENLENLFFKYNENIDADFAFCVARACVKEVYLSLNESVYRKNHSTEKLIFLNISRLAKEYGLNINTFKSFLIKFCWYFNTRRKIEFFTKL